MTTLPTKSLVPGVLLALLATLISAPAATADPAPGIVSHASAVEAAKKAKKKAKKKVKTSSSFGMTSWGGEAALGTVSSKNAKCVNNRKVKLFLIRPGKSKKLVGVDRRTGKPRGNGDGYWVIPVNLKKGKKYQAVVTKRVVGKVICRAYKSSKLPYLG